MRNDHLTAEAAASLLTGELANRPWFTAAGFGTHLGEPVVFLYHAGATEADLAFVKNGYRGFRVEPRSMPRSSVKVM